MVHCHLQDLSFLQFRWALLLEGSRNQATQFIERVVYSIASAFLDQLFAGRKKKKKNIMNNRLFCSLLGELTDAFSRRMDHRAVSVVQNAVESKMTQCDAHEDAHVHVWRRESVQVDVCTVHSRKEANDTKRKEEITDYTEAREKEIWKEIQVMRDEVHTPLLFLRPMMWQVSPSASPTAGIRSTRAENVTGEDRKRERTDSLHDRPHAWCVCRERGHKFIRLRTTACF